MTVNVLWLFLTVSWVGLKYVIAVFPDHAQLIFKGMTRNYLQSQVSQSFTCI